MISPDFTFNHKCIVRRWLKRGVSGNEYGDDEQYRCRFDFSLKMSTNNGNGLTSAVYANGSVWFSAGVRISPQDVIIFEEKTYKVVACRPCYDWTGKENHVEVDIQ